MATRHLQSGYWHGSDAWVMAKDGRDVVAILVGGYTEEEAKKIKKEYAKDECKSHPWDDDIVYLEDPDEWDDQND